MFFYINFSNGQASWYTAPLALLFLSPSFLWQVLELPFAILGTGSWAWLWAGRGGNLQQQLYGGLVNILLCGLLGWVVFKLAKWAREQGLWQTMRALLLTGVHGGTHRNSRQSQGERIGDVIKRFNRLPIEKYKAVGDVSMMSVRELKALLAKSHVDVSKMTEKSELVAAFLASRASTDSSCSICCDDYKSDDDLRVLNCGHKFHLECIDRWFLSSTDYSRAVACPYCNAEL